MKLMVQHRFTNSGRPPWIVVSCCRLAWYLSLVTHEHVSVLHKPEGPSQSTDTLFYWPSLDFSMPFQLLPGGLPRTYTGPI